jgi:glucoamylase
MASAAADFIRDFGPWTAQERWEESQGASPSTIAAEITALWLAGEMADSLGDKNRARGYWATGDHWAYKPNDNLEAWTFTSSGGVGNGKYYQRIEAGGGPDQPWDPNDDARYWIANGGAHMREKDVLDGGFLELVRFGVRRARDYHIMETISDYDSHLRVQTNKGPSYFRYTGDRYNYDDSSGRQTNGMLWPFFTGERGSFEMALRRELGQSKIEIEESSIPYIEAMEAFATPSFMLPEQVWDNGEFQGLPTGAATPLGWTHGEYLKIIAARMEATSPTFIPEVSARARKLEGLSWDQIQKLSR